MNNTEKKWVLLSSLFFIIYILVDNFLYTTFLDRTKKITFCQLVEVSIQAEGDPTVDYNYVVNFKNYTSFFGIHPNETSKYKKLYNKMYLIEYSSKHPSISGILLDYPVDTLGKGNLIPKDGWKSLKDAEIFFGIPPGGKLEDKHITKYPKYYTK
jgi:hypothetical protein